MILTNIIISQELLNKHVAGKTRSTSLGYLPHLGKSSAPLGSVGWEVLGD